MTESKLGTKAMKMMEWKGNYVWYKIACDCGAGECDSTIAFEIDKDFGDIEVNFYQNIKWADYWKNEWFFTRWWARIKVALKVLWTGEMRLEGGFIVQGEDHMNSFVDAVQEGRDKMIQWKEDFEKEQKKNAN